MLSKFEGKLRKQGIVKDKHGWKRQAKNLEEQVIQNTFLNGKSGDAGIVFDENMSPKANYKIQWADEAPKIIAKPQPNTVISPSRVRKVKAERPRPNSAKRPTKKTSQAPQAVKPRPQSAGKRKPSPRNQTLSKTFTTKRKSTPLGTISTENLSNTHNKLCSKHKNQTGMIFRSFDKEKENKKTPVRAFK